MKKLIRKFLLIIASLLPKGKGSDYPQLWYYMPLNRKLRKLMQRLCGIFVGHELSKTEKGYGGGVYADQWCRWCDKVFKVPVQEIEWCSEMKDLIAYGLSDVQESDE